jgi:hypothetical protein
MEFLGAAKLMSGHNLLPLIEIGLTYLSEILGKAAALSALPLITPLL